MDGEVLKQLKVLMKKSKEVEMDLEWKATCKAMGTALAKDLLKSLGIKNDH